MLADEILGVLEATVLLGGFTALVTRFVLAGDPSLPGNGDARQLTLLLGSVAKLGEAQKVQTRIQRGL